MWIIIRKHEVPDKVTRMIKIFYEDFESAAEDQGEICSWFSIKTGVKQKCDMLGFLFLIVVDWVMRKLVGHGENGIRSKLRSKLDDLDFADDIVFFPLPDSRCKIKQ